jgi:DNA repair exonuclease SbcCD nuclease subunit
MSQLIELNDLHIKEKEPFFSANRDFFEWTLNQPWNNSDNILIQKGDLFNNSHPTPTENDLVCSFLRRCKFKQIYLMKGNHDFSYKFKNSLKPLKNISENIILIEEPCKIKIDNLNILLLPNLYDDEINNKKMKEYYENLPDDLKDNKYDYCFYHFEDNTSNTSRLNNGINLSYLDVNIYSGAHIHKNDGNHYNGVHIPTRFDEKGQHNPISIIDTINKNRSFIQVPYFLDFIEVVYPNDLNNNNNDNIIYPIYDILDVPSEVLAKNFYKEKYKDTDKIYFRKFFKKINEKKLNNECNIIVNDNNKKSIKDYFNKYVEDNNLENMLIDICKNYIN